MGAQRAAILRAVLFLSAAGLAVQSVAVWFIPNLGVRVSAVSWVGIGAIGLLYWLARRWHDAAAWLYTLGLMGVLSAYLFYGGGLAMGYASLLGVVAVQGALVLGPRAGAVLTVWAVALTVISYFVGSSSVLLLGERDPAAILLSTQIVALLVLGSLVTFAMQRLHDALHAWAADRERLNEAKLESQRFVMAMGEPVWVTESDLTVVLANTAANEIVGAGSVAGLNLSRWLTMPSLDDRRSRGEGVLASVRGDLPVQVTRSTIEHGTSHRWVIVASDLSRRVEAEERIREAASVADEANRAKSYFLANISHELRTPLNAILGYTEMLLETPRSSEEVSDVERIHHAGTHLLGLINDILDMSKIEAGEMDVTDEVHSLGRIVAECVATMRPQADAQRNVVLVEGPDVIVRSDGRKLSQILLNLMSNAVKFTHHGTIRVQTAVASQLRIDVIDSGRGISVDDMDRLFQPFRQLGQDAVLQPGTGLGLVLCQRLAALLGGTIEARSEEAVGSTFSLLLPLSCVQSVVASEPPTTS